MTITQPFPVDEDREGRAGAAGSRHSARKTLPVIDTNSERALMSRVTWRLIPFLFLLCWCPAAERARAVGRFMAATAVANIIGNPISGALLAMHGLAGLHGWQWLFLLEGLPACLLGLVVLFYLPNGPQDAKWLAP